MNVCRALGVTTLATVLATAALLAQFGSFDPSFDGELWGVRHELTPGGGAIPAGVAFADGKLFVADSKNQTVIAYNAGGQVESIAGAEWASTNPLSPVAGLIPHQLAKVVVNVDGTDHDALLISDAESNRVAAFEATGAYLFTLRLQRPTAAPTFSLSIGQMAMSSGAKFNLNTVTSTLTLSGSFAAAWREQQMSGSVHSGALAFLGASATFTHSGSEFLATATSVLTGTESNPVAPAPQYMFGVTFDKVGNLYVLDAFTERLHVYGPDLSRLFTFGTPVADGTTAEFSEPWGLTFWPDAVGTSGRIFINDTYNSRILIYRPVDGPDADTVLDRLQFEAVIEHFVAPDPAIELFSIALDPATATIAVTDFALPRVVVLKRPGLAAFNLQILDDDDEVISGVCAATTYKVRFSLTVPAGLAAVDGVTPTLLIDGVPATVMPAPAATYPSSTLSAGEVMTFTYAMPGITDDVDVIAGATASNPIDILSRAETIAVANCADETGPTTFDLVPGLPAQVSGWTPVLQHQTYSIALNAQDDDGIGIVEYELDGASRTPGTIKVTFDNLPTDAPVMVPIPDFGPTTLRYRARDGNGIWSGWQTFDARTKQVVNRTTNENVAVEFRVGDPEGTGFSYSVEGLPAGVTFSEETGQFAGVTSFDAHQPYSADPVLSSGVYNVVVKETASGGETSSVGFTWTINHINRDPIITNQPVQGLSIQQGQLFELQINGSDLDGDPVVFTVRGRSANGHDLPQSISIDPGGGLISGIFPLDADTDYAIIVGLAECSEQTAEPPCDRAPLPGNHLATLYGFELSVLDANLPPGIVNPGAQSSAEGDAVSLQIQVSDAEGDELSFEAGGLPAGLTIDADTGLISGTVTFDAAGPHSVTVEVDDHVNTPVQSVTFAWTVTATNRPPVVAIPDRVNIEGDTLLPGASIGSFAFDPEASPVTFVSATGLPPGVVMSATGALTGSFDFVSASVYTVTVRVSDGTAVTEDVFTWTVQNTNRAPVMTLANRTNGEGDVVVYQLPGTDADGDALEFSINGLPPGLTLNTATGVITGTLGYGSAGAHTVNVGVRDLVAVSSLSILRTFTWTIADNRAPQAIDDVATVRQGASVSIRVRDNDSDADNDTLTMVSVTPATNHGLAVINASGGTITFTATSLTSLGTSTFSYTITDGELTSTAVVTVTIIPNNAPPVCSAAAGGEIWPPNHKKFYAAPIKGVFDPDGNPITITVTGILQDEKVDSTGDGQFAPDGRIENGQAWIRAERNGQGNKAAGNGRVYEILFTASDGRGGSCTGSVLWTVPHDQGRRATAVDDGVRYDSTSAVPGTTDKKQIHQKSPKP